uniref:Uncharacterized protein n=1 Tax=Schlesneria paludicola TaxID=360056 RepID=A0A7C4LKU3_9PLAN
MHRAIPFVLAMLVGSAWAAEAVAQTTTITSRKNIFGGYDFSDGSSSRKNIFGGYDYKPPGGTQTITSRPNIFGGYDYSDGSSSRKNIFGGYDYRPAPQSRNSATPLNGKGGLHPSKR